MQRWKKKHSIDSYQIVMAYRYKSSLQNYVDCNLSINSGQNALYINFFNCCLTYEKRYFTYSHVSHVLGKYNLLNEGIKGGRECEAAWKQRLIRMNDASSLIFSNATQFQPLDLLNEIETLRYKVRKYSPFSGTVCYYG